MKRRNLLIVSLITFGLALMLFVGIVKSQPAATVVQPTVVAQPVRPIEQPKAIDETELIKVGATTPKVLGATPPGWIAPVQPKDDEVTDWKKLGELAAKVFDDWRTFGALAGIIALINLLIWALRLKVVDDFLTKKNWKKYKPYVAAALGAILTALSSIFTGMGIIQAIIAGLVFGFTSSGLHQAIFPSGKEAPANG